MIKKHLYQGPDSLAYRYVKNVGIGLSQIAHVILGGDPDETISGATGKASREGVYWFKHVQEPFIDWLFSFDPNHCQNAIEDDEGSNAIYTHYDRTKEYSNTESEEGAQ